MEWRQLDRPTRIGFVATVLAALGSIAPPLGISSAVVAIISSGVAWRNAHRSGESNPVARACFLGSSALVVVIVVGNAIYGAGA